MLGQLFVSRIRTGLRELDRLRNFGFDLSSNLELLLRIFSAVQSELRNVNQTFNTLLELNEETEVSNAADNTLHTSSSWVTMRH